MSLSDAKCGTSPGRLGLLLSDIDSGGDITCWTAKFAPSPGLLLYAARKQGWSSETFGIVLRKLRRQNNARMDTLVAVKDAFNVDIRPFLPAKLTPRQYYFLATKHVFSSSCFPNLGTTLTATSPDIEYEDFCRWHLSNWIGAVPSQSLCDPNFRIDRFLMSVVTSSCPRSLPREIIVIIFQKLRVVCLHDAPVVDFSLTL